MRKIKFAYFLVLAVSIFLNFVHTQQGKCEVIDKSEIILRDEDWVDVPQDNPFKNIITDENVANYDKEQQIIDENIAGLIKLGEEQRIKEQRRRATKEMIFFNVPIIALISTIVIFISIFKRKIFLAMNKSRKSIYYFLKRSMGVLFKNKSAIGKIIISLIAILAFYRCAIKPPVYYRDSHNRKVYTKKYYADKEVSTVDIYKLASEMFGAAILTGLVYFLVVRKNDKR